MQQDLYGCGLKGKDLGARTLGVAVEVEKDVDVEGVDERCDVQSLHGRNVVEVLDLGRDLGEVHGLIVGRKREQKDL